MFAGAVRETVLSNPEVIRRVNADFVPVALKAALVNNPPAGIEGRLYSEIGRSKIVPQGICVANSAGKVLQWVLMFDDDQSILAFLDHSLKRFRKYPDAEKRVPAERYARFPSARLDDVQDTGQVTPIVERHASGKSCPAKQRFQPGTIVARVFGRTLTPDGKPTADTTSQYHYVEDRFSVPVAVQVELAKALATADTGRVRLPDELGRLCVTYAYLGMLDVQPLYNPAGAEGDLRQCEFWAQKADERDKPGLWRVEGQTDVFTDRMANAGPGDLHEVKLKWQGFITMSGKRMTRLVLSARGTERLKFGSARRGDVKLVASLPSGRPVDLACRVRYGIIGEPAAADEVSDEQPRPQRVRQQAGPGSNGTQQLIGMLGPRFIVFRPAAQQHLKVSDDQKQKLQQAMKGALQGFQDFQQQIVDAPPPQRQQQLHEFRQEANKVFGRFLAELLKPEQQKRLRQIVLQQQGLFALGDPEVAAGLKLSDQQKTEFATTMQETHKRFERLQQKAQSSGNPEEIQKEAAKIHKEQETKIEALLTDAQKDQWKAMIGKLLKLDT